MSAIERRHEDAPKKIDDRVISEERLSRMQAPGSEETFALSQERAEDVDQRPDVTSGAALEEDETCERLLCAINETETARRIRALMPANERQPHTAACAEPPQALFPAAGAEAHPSARLAHRAPAARLTRTFMVQTSPIAAAMSTIPPTATPPRQPAPAEPDSILEKDKALLEKDKARYRLLRTIFEGGHLGGEIPASNPQLRHLVQTSPQAASMPLMPSAASTSRHPAPPEPDSIVERDSARERLLRAICATEIAGRLGGEFAASNPQSRMRVQTSPQAASAPLMPPPAVLPQRRVSATTSKMVETAMIEAVPFAAIPQFPSSTQPVAVVSGSPPAITAPLPPMSAQDDSTRVTILVWCKGQINRLGAKLALAAKSTSRTAIQLSVHFKNWMGTKAVPAMEHLGRSVWQLSVRSSKGAEARAVLTVKSTSRATIHLSIHFKNWISTKAVPAMEHLGRSVWQLPVRNSKRAEARAVLTVKSRDIAGPQPSTGLGDRVRAMQSTSVLESTDQPRPQSPTRFKMWFGPRRSPRLEKPPAVAYCWTADTPHSIKIADISTGGVHLLTDVRWPRGGAFSMTLKRTDIKNETPGSWIVIDFIVIRYCDDGVAGTFIPSTHRLSPYIPTRAENCADEWTLKRFVKHLAVPGRS